jgi:nitroimidazol reductase NimA-like FMN-containing flavoprotein (pyridoxamine 5'-phosphate oxidase superfamily)
MRRKEQEIRSHAELEAILHRATVCRLGLAVGNEPYVVPVSFGYQDGCLYVHSSPEGKKIEMLRQNPRVCFEVDVEEELVRKDTPCAWSIRYRSVIGWGRAAFLTAEEEKRRALDVIMAHYGGAVPGNYTEKGLREVTVLRIEIAGMTGKKSGY